VTPRLQDLVVTGGTVVADTEYVRGREAVMAGARQRIILAECEFLRSLLVETEMGYGVP